VAIEVTREGVEVLRRSLELAGLDPAAAGVRLRGARTLGGGFDVQVELADAPLEDEMTIDADGVRLFVDPQVLDTIPNAVVAVEPQHETVVVRPSLPRDAGMTWP
jgi:Fe-S cluster assembly iron-binding protein IscA